MFVKAVRKDKLKTSFDRSIQLKLGLGHKINFWEDVWVGNLPLN